MKYTGKYFIPAVTFALIFLWVYAAISKLSDFSHFKAEMHNQTLVPQIQFLLIYFLPLIELIVAGLLIFNRTFLTGLYASAVLLTLFSGYIILAILHFFRHVPCSCGGILEHLGWTAHLIFNLSYLTLNLFSIFIAKNKEVR